MEGGLEELPTNKVEANITPADAAEKTVAELQKNISPNKEGFISKIRKWGPNLALAVSTAIIGGRDIVDVNALQNRPPSHSDLPGGIPSQVEFERLVTPTPEPPPVSTPTTELAPISTLAQKYSLKEEPYRSPLFDVWKEKGEVELVKSVDIDGSKVDFWLNRGSYNPASFFTENSVNEQDFLNRARGVFNEVIPYTERATGMSLPKYNVVVTHGRNQGGYSEAFRGTNVIGIDAELWNKGTEDKEMYSPRLSAAHEVFHLLNDKTDPDESKFGRELSAIIHEAGFLANTFGKERLKDDLNRRTDFIRKNKIDMSDLTRPAVTRVLAYDTALRVLNIKGLSLEEVNRQLLLDSDNGIESFNEIAKKMGLGFTFEELLKEVMALTPTPTIPPTPTQEVTPTPSQSPQQEQAERKELVPYTPSITIVDAAPSVPTEGLIQKEFVSNEDMIRQMLGDKYVSKEQIIQEFGLDYADKWDEVVDKYLQTLVYRLTDTYFSHGEKVARVAEDTLEKSGLRSTGMEMLPLQKIFDNDSIKFIKDSSGNPGISLNFDPKRIIKLLENDPSRVVNGSFQVGNVELFQETSKSTFISAEYIDSEGNVRLWSSSTDTKHTFPSDETYKDEEGNEIPLKLRGEPKIKETKSTSISIVGAYTKEKAMENLPKLFEVANAYPDKFFVFAGGNGGEDFREAMVALKDKVPKNLLITAEWVKAPAYEYEGPPLYSYDGKFHGGVWGPEIYVNNSALGAPGGSSFSVPELATEIDMLLRKGFSPQQAREKILASIDSHLKTLADETEVALKVFNPQLLKTK